MEREFTGEIWTWRGPAPYYFVTVPDDHSEDLQADSAFTSYGWGCIPVTAQIGDTTWTTSLFPRNGLYALPVKIAVRRAEDVDEGDVVSVRMRVGWD